MYTNPSRTHLERAQMLLQRSAPSDLVIAQALVSIAASLCSPSSPDVIELVASRLNQTYGNTCWSMLTEGEKQVYREQAAGLLQEVVA